MYPRTEYEMTEKNLKRLLAACKPTPVMKIGKAIGPSPQENANDAWRKLGKEMGFDWKTVRPISGKGQRFFTAVPLESEEARAEREAREAEEHKEAEIAEIDAQMQTLTERRKELTEGKGE